MKPFRWNITKREQLGRLPELPPQDAVAEYEEQLAECAAKLVARSRDARMVFVGRSPENLFDYLSGIFAGTAHEGRIDLLNISNRGDSTAVIRRESPAAYLALQQHFRELGLAPDQIIARPAVVFCDLVAEGGTFRSIFEFLRDWCLELKCDLSAMTRKLSFLGITWRQKTSPNTWRWQQHADWLQTHKQIKAMNVSIPGELWSYLGNQQKKVANTNRPELWAHESILLPPRAEGNRQALAQAYAIYERGRAERAHFAERLAALPEIKAAWLRGLAGDLRLA